MADQDHELTGSRRPAPQGAIRLRDVDPHAILNLTVTLRGPDLPTLDAMPVGPLSRAKIDAAYGVPPEKVQEATRRLKTYGLQVVSVTQGGRSLKVTGSAVAVASTFKADLGIYEAPGEGQIRARTGTLMIPDDLKELVAGVFGIDQRRMARRHTARPRAVTGGPLTPLQLAERYNFPNDQGGQTIAIAEFGQPLGPSGQALPPAFIASDIPDYCRRLNVPTPNVRTVPVGLSPLTRQQYDTYLRQAPKQLAALLTDQTGETMMDVEIVAALCPRADISVYFSTWSEAGWVDLLDAVTAEATAPVVLSISYGLAEEAPDWSQGAMAAINDRLQIAAMRGITVCVSSGDDGSGCDQPGSQCHVEFPASSPFVLAVGGTMIVDAEPPNDEVVWWEAPGRRTSRGGGSTGAGVSGINARPPWQPPQIETLNLGALNGRVVPDVSALAGPPFYDLIFEGEPIPGGAGGTSAATPLWASLIARIDAALPAASRQRFLAPLLYQATVAPGGFVDIKLGDNTSNPAPGVGYQAAPGFDAASGWGVPNGKRLLQVLNTPAAAAVRQRIPEKKRASVP